MKKYKIKFQKEDYSFDFVIIEANSKREAVDKFKPIRGPGKTNYWLGMTEEVKQDPLCKCAHEKSLHTKEGCHGLLCWCKKFKLWKVKK